MSGPEDAAGPGAAGEPVRPARIPWYRLVYDQAGITAEVADYPYRGSGTDDDPYVVHWIPDDARNPMNFSMAFRWWLTAVAAVTTLAVALVSSGYTGSIPGMMAALGSSGEVATLGLSLYVLGFALGPLLWGPLSEMYGRQVVFVGTYAAFAAFNAGAAGADSAATVIVLRFFAGAWGSSPLTNAGGIIADMFPASQRGLALSLFASAPMLGPVLGPIVGGFAGMNAGRGSPR